MTSALLVLLLTADAGVAEGTAPLRPAPAAARVRIQPGTAKPGDAVLITVYGAREQPVGSLGAWNLNFLPFRGGHQALIGLPADLKIAPLKVGLRFATDAEEEDYALTLDVVEPNFRRDELKVAKKFVSPAKAERKWMREDQKQFDAAFSQPLEARRFEVPFEWPRLDRIAAPYGDLRMFNGKRKSQHYGIDIDGNTGDPAYAANDGVVVMTRECFGSGNTVLIHHGAALYTAYFHLSRIDVKLGQELKLGDQVGLIGKTGRVTGPHLHWGVKIDGRWVDGQSLLRLDFE